MGRIRREPVVDPATGKALPDGVSYRGPGQYLARKLVNDRRVVKTLESAKKASDWIKAVEVDSKRGVFVDTTEAQRVKLGSLLRSYQLEMLADNPARVVLDDDKRPTPYRPMRPVDEQMTTELLGAREEITFIDVILRDDVCAIRMAALTGADMAQFRNRMKKTGYAPSTIVRRLNLVARAGAERVWVEGFRVGPDLPFVYLHRGLSELNRGDLKAAEADLAAASANAPHFADPLKAWGDLLARAGRWKEALTKYDEALKYAPAWAALQQARDGAAPTSVERPTRALSGSGNWSSPQSASRPSASFKRHWRVARERTSQFKSL